MKKVIKGIGLLDLTTATKESLKGVNLIKGVGCLLVGENHKSILEDVELKGIGTSITVPVFDSDSVVAKMGSNRFDANFLASSSKPMVLVVVGIGVFEGDVTVELAQEKIASIYGAGIIACPEHLAGVINAKTSGHAGIITSYKQGTCVNMQDLKITNEYLNALEDDTSILSVGDITMLSDVDEALFKQKIDTIHYVGDIISYERYRSLLTNAKGEGDLDFIPDGFIYHGNQAELSSAEAEIMDGESWYVDKALYIKEDVTEEMLKRSLKAAHCARVVCPRTVLRTVKSLLVNQAKCYPYTNKVRVYNAHTITATQLQYEKEPVCVIVENSLIFHEDVTAELVEEKIECIVNLNSIVCEPEIYPIIMDKVCENAGKVHPRSEEKKDEIVIAKGMGYLKL